MKEPNKIVYHKYKTNSSKEGGLYPFWRPRILHIEFDKNANSKDEVSYIISSYLFYTILFGDKSELAFFRCQLRLAPFYL